MSSVGVPVARDKAKLVLDILAAKKAMSLVELMSAVDLPDSEVEQIVHGLENHNLVRISHHGVDEDSIITVLDQGLRAAG